MPVMETVDRLHFAIKNKKKTLKKLTYDIRYYKHEAELLEMDQRVLEILMKKKNEQKN
jgi:uncharacterized protein YoxC